MKALPSKQNVQGRGMDREGRVTRYARERCRYGFKTETKQCRLTHMLFTCMYGDVLMLFIVMIRCQKTAQEPSLVKVYVSLMEEGSQNTDLRIALCVPRTKNLSSVCPERGDAFLLCFFGM